MKSSFTQVVDSLEATWAQLQALLPRLFGAIALVTIGWLLARGLRKLTVRLLRLARVDRAAEHAGIEDFLLRGGVRFTTVTLLSQVVYWGVLLVAVLAGFNLLGVPATAELIEQVVSFLPNVLAALVIVVFGTLLSRFVRGAVHTYLSNAGVQGGHTIGLFTQGAVLAFVATLALEQLRIGGQVLVSAFQLAFGGLCLALALAFGLGGRDWAAKVLERTWGES